MTESDSAPGKERPDAHLTEQRVREIMREEIAERERQSREATRAFLRRDALQRIDDNLPAPGDGPLVSEIKAMFRDGANEYLGATEPSEVGDLSC